MSEILTLEFSESARELVNLSVINLAGQTVFKQATYVDLANRRFTLDLQQLAEGIYYLNVSTSKGVQNLKLVIKH